MIFFVQPIDAFNSVLTSLQDAHNSCHLDARSYLVSSVCPQSCFPTRSRVFQFGIRLSSALSWLLRLLFTADQIIWWFGSRSWIGLEGHVAYARSFLESLPKETVWRGIICD